MFSLDSDTVNLSLRGHPAVSRRIESADPAALSVCTIVVEEVVGGQIGRINALRSRCRPMERESGFLADLMRSLSTLQILPYTDEAEQLYQSWTAKQKRVGPSDCRIAASAILGGFTVINGHHLQRQRLLGYSRRHLAGLEQAITHARKPPGIARRLFLCLTYLQNLCIIIT